MMKIDYIWLIAESDRNIFYDPHTDRYYSSENRTAEGSGKQIAASLIAMPFILFFLNSINEQFQQVLVLRLPLPLIWISLLVLSVLISEIIVRLPSFARGYPPTKQLQPADFIVTNGVFINRILKRFQTQLYAVLIVFTIPLCLAFFMLVFEEKSLAFFILLSISIAVAIVVCRIVVRPWAKLKYLVGHCEKLRKGNDEIWLGKFVCFIGQNVHKTKS